MAVCAAAKVEAKPIMLVSFFHGFTALDGVEGTELEATVRDDSSEEDADTSVDGQEALGTSSRLLQAIEQTVEGLLSRADIRSEVRSDSETPRRLHRMVNWHRPGQQLCH